MAEITPEGPGIVIEVDGKEAFILADTAGEWLAELGYHVFTPIRFRVGVESTASPAPSEFENDDGDAG
jgi:hypothetical protein